MEEKKGKKNVDKRKRFMDLAAIRVNNVFKHLRRVGNMTNKNNYTYEIPEFRKIIKDIRTELNLIEGKLETEVRKKAKTWKL